MFFDIVFLTVSYSVVKDEISVSRFFIFKSKVSSFAFNFAFSVVYLASDWAIAVSSEIYLI